MCYSTCHSLSRYCPKLQRLNLNSCSTITDLSLKDLAEGCHQITHINISWCDQITDSGTLVFISKTSRNTNKQKLLAGVEALAQGCKKLKFFIAKGCLQINDKAVSCLANNCPNLESINLHSCSVRVCFLVAAKCFILCVFRI